MVRRHHGVREPKRTSPDGGWLLVFVKGGVLKSEADGRATLWRNGRVVWLDPATSADEGSRKFDLAKKGASL